MWLIQIDTFVFVKGYFMVRNEDGFSDSDASFGSSLVILVQVN